MAGRIASHFAQIERMYLPIFHIGEDNKLVLEDFLPVATRIINLKIKVKERDRGWN